MNLPKLKPFTKGLLSFALPGLRTVHGYDNPIGAISATSCYSIFLRHMSLLHKAGIPSVPKIVAELGPGSSIGTGLAALLAGAEKYYALDLIPFSDITTNLKIFDQLVDLFTRRVSIPSSGIHSLRFPDLDCYEFPAFITCASQEKVAAIRNDMITGEGIFVESMAPWTDQSIGESNSVDWIWSQSVMEHIDDLNGAYASQARWLKIGGYTSHLIDFGCHGLTQEWNGHWAIKDGVWSIIRGKRPYLINRIPYSGHVSLAREHGFASVLEKRNKMFSGLIPVQFAPRFRGISDEDARSAMVMVVNRFDGN